MSAARREIVHVVVRGRVQGVGYRAFVEDEAVRLGIDGWVRNRRDGASVEALFAGSEHAVRAMVERCREGPMGARIDDIVQREGTPQELAQRGQGLAFAVLPTG